MEASMNSSAKEDRMGSYEQFLAKLAQFESRGKKDPYKTENNIGYLGKYQMGEKALEDAGYYKKDGTGKNDWKGEWTGRDGVNSKSDFLSNPQAQENAIRAYHEKVWRYIENARRRKSIGLSCIRICLCEG